MLPAAFRAALREAARHDVLVVRRHAGPRTARARSPRALAERPSCCSPRSNGELSGEAFTWGKSWGDGVPGRLVRDAVALRNSLLRDADAFVAMSRLIRDEMLAALGARGARFACCRTASTPRASSRHALTSRRRCARCSGCPRELLAVYSGRLLRGKGLETLVEALRLASGPRDMGVVLVGSGEGQRSTRRRALSGAWPSAGSGSGWCSPGASRRVGLPACQRSVRVPVAVRGSRHRARRGRSLRPAGGRVAHRRDRGRRGGRALRPARAARATRRRSRRPLRRSPTTAAVGPRWERRRARWRPPASTSATGSSGYRALFREVSSSRA